MTEESVQSRTKSAKGFSVRGFSVRAGGGGGGGGGEGGGEGGGGGKGQRSRRILPDMQTADVEQSAMATDTQRRSLAMTSITS